MSLTLIAMSSMMETGSLQSVVIHFSLRGATNIFFELVKIHTTFSAPNSNRSSVFS